MLREPISQLGSSLPLLLPPLSPLGLLLPQGLCLGMFYLAFLSINIVAMKYARRLCVMWILFAFGEIH